MVIIGQKLRSTVPEARRAMENKEKDTVLRLAGTQKECGADFLEISAAGTHDEKACLAWAVKLISQTMAVRLVLGVSDADTAEYVFSACGPLEGCILSCVTPDVEQFDDILDAAVRHGTGIAARPAPYGQAPAGGRARSEILRRMVEKISLKDVALDRITLKLAAQPAQTAWDAPADCIEAARTLRDGFPGIHIAANIPAVSDGMPQPGILNTAFAAALLEAGADTFVLDPTDAAQMLSVRAANLMMGRDENCSEYLALAAELAES